MWKMMVVFSRDVRIILLYIALGFCPLVYAQQYPIYELEPIVVTASKSPTAFSHIARSVIVITRSEIERAPGHSVQDLLKYALGVDARRRGPQGIQADVSIRGGTFEQTLVLVDGMKVNDPQTGHHNLDLPLSLDDVERIEILKGHGSRLYGPNAFGGVINIMTRSGREKGVRLKGIVGEYGFTDGGLSLSYPSKISAHYLSISRRTSTGYRDDTDFDMYNGYYGSATHFGLGEAHIAVGYVDKRFGANSFYSNLFPNEWEHTKTTFLHTGVHLKTRRRVFSSKVYWRRHKDDFMLDRERPQWYRNRHTTDVYGFEWQSTFVSRWGFSAFGGELGKEEIESGTLGNHSRVKGGLFFEHHVEPGQRLALVLGASGYHYSDWGWKIWPGVDVGFQVIESMRAYGSVGRSFRVPTYTELHYNSPANKGDPNLLPEEAWTYEAGLTWRKKYVWGSLALFRREGYNLIDWGRMGSTDPWKAGNIARVNTNGGEIEVGFHPIALIPYLPVRRIWLGYTFLDSDKEVKDFESKYTLNYLQHQSILDVEHPLVFKWQQNWKLRYEERVGGKKLFLVDTRIDRRFKQVELFIDATNLFNITYTEVGGVPMPGRWVMAGLKLHLMPK